MLLPLVRPALAAVVVLTMVASWNNYFLPLLVLNSEKLYTLPLGIMQYQGQYGTDWARVLAFISLALVPTIIFYLVAERHIVSGLTAGAVKGLRARGGATMGCHPDCRTGLGANIRGGGGSIPAGLSTGHGPSTRHLAWPLERALWGLILIRSGRSASA